MSVSASRIVSLCPNYKITELPKSCSFGHSLEGRSNNRLTGSASSRNGLKLNAKRKSKSDSAADADVSSLEKMVNDLVLKQTALFNTKKMGNGCRDETKIVLPGNSSSLTQAYDLCCQHALKDRDSTFYVVWCRRTDELVDGPNASQVTPSDLDNWESRLEQIFQGRPLDLLDAALSDTVSRFHIDIQPFKDMIEGMRMDLWKSRYKNFSELYLYSDRVAGALGFITVPIMGIASESQATTERIFGAALALGTANQLTNILRDVGEDARRGRIYLPQDELAQAGLSDDDIFARKVTDKWRSFMKKQIKRARLYFDEAERGLPDLNADCRWAVWASLVLYRQILEEIEANDYNNFTKRARLSNPRKILSLPIAYARSLVRRK